MEDEFEPTWQALFENGSSRKNKDATKRFWDTLTPVQQHQAYLSITQKVRENKFVQYDPIRAIKENIRKHRTKEPTNLNGSPAYDTKIKKERVVSAKYGTEYGVYTLAEAEEFHMEIGYGMNFDYEQYKQQKQQTNG